MIKFKKRVGAVWAAPETSCLMWWIVPSGDWARKTVGDTGDTCQMTLKKIMCHHLSHCCIVTCDTVTDVTPEKVVLPPKMALLHIYSKKDG